MNSLQIDDCPTRPLTRLLMLLAMSLSICVFGGGDRFSWSYGATFSLYHLMRWTYQERVVSRCTLAWVNLITS